MSVQTPSESAERAPQPADAQDAGVPAAARPPEGGDGERERPPIEGRGPRIPPSSAASLGVLVLLGIYAVYMAKALLLPVVAAAIAALVLRPILAGLARFHVPRAVSAPLLLVALIGALGAGVTLGIEPATRWLERAPESLRHIERELRPVKEPIEKVSDATKQVEDMASMDAGEDGPDVQVDTPRTRIADTVLSATPGVIGGVAVTLALLLLFLLAGEAWPARVAGLLGARDGPARMRVIRAAEAVERDVSAYLLTIGAINACLGVATAGLLFLLDVPNAALWGAMAAVFNFVPYLGAMVTALVIGAVSLLAFDDLAGAVVPPLCFMGLTGLEGLVITPQLVGARLRLHPLAVLLALLGWSWLWGVAGALVAVPLLAATKLSLERSRRFASLAKALEP